MFRPEFFFFRKKDTIIHKLDPRSKITYVLAMFILALLRGDFLYLFIVFLISLIPLFIAKIFYNFLVSLRTSLIFIFLIFIINFIFTYDLFLSLAFVLRFLILISSFLAFSLTTSPDDLALALYRMKFPYDFVLIFTLSVRFIPTVIRDVNNIIDAQRSRGLETQKGFINRIKNYLPVLIPLLAVGIKRAINVAESMESRGFGATEKPTTLYDLRFSFYDYLLSFLCLFSLFLAAILFYLG